ncbi:hypothetical protein AMST5_04181 [freshwater sediment metagenome]|uniref:Uncharacterized protein n=1 Tax=freshwater sediment metagenome TaxID=556182 RepID=A0AA48M4G6_9ZZZZ
MAGSTQERRLRFTRLVESLLPEQRRERIQIISPPRRVARMRQIPAACVMTRVRRLPRARDRDAGAFRRHHLIQRRRIPRREPDAAMGGRPAERSRRVGPMDGVAAVEKNRMRHGRHVVFAGIMHPLQTGRGEMAPGRHIAGPGRRDRPAVAPLGGVHMHGLGRQIDMNVHAGVCRGREAKRRDHDRGEGSRNMHRRLQLPRRAAFKQ